MALTPLPDPPQTADPANFATKADALVAALATMVSEINAGGIEYTGGIMTGLVTANAGIALPAGQTLSGAGSIDISGTLASSSANPGGITQQAWIAPTLLNSWANYGGSTEVAGYFKDSFGVVHIRGMIKDGTIGTVAFTLPVGSRPTAEARFAVNSTGGFGNILIAANGDVTPDIGANTYVSMSGIQFDVR